MTGPAVSVVIPVHDAAHTLVEQLDALAVAAADDLEILVIDNRSTDGSADVASRWAAEHDLDLRVVDASDRAGEPFARNVGLHEARGAFVLYCDADDRVAPTWITAMRTALRDAAYATGPIEMHALNPAWIADVRGSSVTGRSLMYDRVPYAHGCNMGFRRDALLAIGGFDESYTAGCDLDIAIRMWEAGHDLAYAEGATIHYRLRPTLRATYGQGRFYGRHRVRIRRRLADAGVGSAGRARHARRALWLTRKAPLALAHRRTRARWVWVLGQLVGERQGELARGTVAS